MRVLRQEHYFYTLFHDEAANDKFSRSRLRNVGDFYDSDKINEKRNRIIQGKPRKRAYSGLSNLGYAVKISASPRVAFRRRDTALKYRLWKQITKTDTNH
jgi:hypothetical protein